jgi:hypothetical protein
VRFGVPPNFDQREDIKVAVIGKFTTKGLYIRWVAAPAEGW